MSIRKRGKGYEIVIEVGKHPDGKRNQKTFMFYGTPEEAKQEEVRLKYEMIYGKFIPDRKKTVKDYLEYWLQWKKEKLRPSTYRSYKDTLEQYIIPELGHIKLFDLTPLKVQEYYDKQVKEGKLSHTSINYHHRVLRAAFNQAEKWRFIRDNPTFGAEPPSIPKYKPTLLSDKQILQVLAALKNDPRYLSILLSLHTGMRRGETCGLTWDNVFEDKKVIKVDYSLGRVKKEGLRLQDTKTGKGRFVPISGSLLMELKRQKERQAVWKQTFGEPYNEDNYVVTWEDGRPMDPDQVTKRYNAVLKELNLPRSTRVHDLRHSHATLLQDMGADIKDVSDELGHSSISITGDIYINPDVERRRPFVEKLDQRLKACEQNVSIDPESGQETCSQKNPPHSEG